MEFYEAVRTGDRGRRSGCSAISSFPTSRSEPLGRLCGVDRQGRSPIVGHGAGPVRPPLTDLTEAEERDLAALVAALGAQ